MRFIEEIKMKGNFYFLYNINRKLYDLLLGVESNARLDFQQAGNDSRKALEEMVSIAIRDKGLEGKLDPGLSLADKIMIFKNERELRRISYLKEKESLKDKPILPDLGRIVAREESGKKKDLDYYDFLRRLGNAASHIDVRGHDLVVDYNSIRMALIGYHRLVKEYYRDRISDDTPGFQENYMPIGRYYIESHRRPNDNQRSKCDIEFFGHTIHRENIKSKYAILRLYRKENIDQEFILRNMDIFYEASKYSSQATPRGMASMDELINYDDENSSFYIIAYEFNQKPEKLNDKILKTIPYDKRLTICKKIADSIKYLHQLELPIYHRMLSHDSLRLCKLGDSWTPFIIKFDFAKLSLEEIYMTIKFQAMDAKDKIKSLEIGKYVAPEWSNLKNLSRINWEKVDIYALGVLFRDILGGRIAKALISIEEFVNMDMSNELLDLLDIMLADSPDFRPSIEEISKVLDEEVDLWN